MKDVCSMQQSQLGKREMVCEISNAGSFQWVKISAFLGNQVSGKQLLPLQPIVQGFFGRQTKYASFKLCEISDLSHMLFICTSKHEIVRLVTIVFLKSDWLKKR